MLVATSGHVDHGKTALIRALTGADTDRLPEERQRGISIDLGFAYWRPDDGATIGFIDVPGHQRFARNMLTGVSGARCALLVVAADEGIKPQTVEHVQILGLLGIEHGVIALSRCDRASTERIAVVRSEVAALLAGSTLRAAPIHAVSAVTRQGIDALSAALVKLRDILKPIDHHGQAFRLAIDRAFSVTGTGTVATGAVHAGRVEAGARLTVCPSGREVRVRGLQSGGAAAAQAVAGERCALNLIGIEPDALNRGDWLVEPALNAPTSRIEAQIEVLAPLRHDSRVHLHLGTASIPARVLTHHQRTVPPGRSAEVQLVLDHPTSAVAGARYVARDAAGVALIGGGIVVDPLAPTRRRPLALRHAMNAALILPDSAASLATLAAIPGFELDRDWFARVRSLTEPALAALLDRPELICLGPGGQIVVTAEKFARLCAALEHLLADHHRAHPESGGMTRREARRAFAEPVSAGLLDSLVGSLATVGRIEAAGALLRLPGHSPSFGAAETTLWQAVLEQYSVAEPRPIILADLVRELRAPEPTLRAMLYRRRLAGQVWQISDTRLMLHHHVAGLAATAAALDSGGTGFTAAQFRDASGLGRNFTILLLEFFDRIGVTRRSGEIRTMRSDQAAIVGSGESDPA
jgi:selenocysteine-specific elongation factor